jgi:hypothetical protein
MPIPVATLRTDKDILAYPVRTPIYDTEADIASTAINVKLTCFKNLAQFQLGTSVSLGAAKVFGRDTNLESSGGGVIPKGNMFLAYGFTLPISWRGLSLATSAQVALYEDTRQIRKMRWVTFRFGETPYWREPMEEVPAGVGIRDVMTTVNEALVCPIANGALSMFNRRSMTLQDLPVILTQNEQFAVDLECSTDFRITLGASQEPYYTPHIHGIYLRGITG